MACSDVILRIGSMVNSFCSYEELQHLPSFRFDLKTCWRSNVKESRFFKWLAAFSWHWHHHEGLTKWNALLSGLTLCFSMYFIRLQFVYLRQIRDTVIYHEKKYLTFCGDTRPLNPLTCSSESLSLVWSVLASFWCLPSLYLSNETNTGLHEHVTPPLTPKKQIIWIVGPGLQGFLSTNTHSFPQQTLIAKRTWFYFFALLFYDFLWT